MVVVVVVIRVVEVVEVMEGVFGVRSEGVGECEGGEEDVVVRLRAEETGMVVMARVREKMCV